MNDFWSMNRAWLELVARVASYGTREKPRGEPTRELIADVLTVDAARAVLTVASRKLGYRFLAAEAAWILSGDDRVATIGPYSRVVSQFSDDGERFYGAYGPRIAEQLDYAVEALARDRSTRKAVINIWRESPPHDTRDHPCTLSVQFLIRDGALHAVVTMRSSDVWLGVPYDVHTFAMLMGYVLLRLREEGRGGSQIGALHQVAGSRHLYESNFGAALRCLDVQSPARVVAPFDPYEFSSPADLVDHLWAVARRDRAGLRGRYLTELLDYEHPRKDPR